MTNPDQTLRERLFAAAKLSDALPDQPVPFLLDVDDALSVFREWLESEAIKAGNECEQDKKSITGGIEASPYLRGRYSAIKVLAQSLGGQND